MSSCVSAIDESLSTLEFAKRAMWVKALAVIKNRNVKSFAAATMATQVGETRDDSVRLV